MPKRTDLEQRLIRKRNHGKAISPCRKPNGKAYRVTTRYRAPGTWWALGYHTGEDYACPTGSLAVAVTWGTVLYVGSVPWGPAYGVAVVVRTRLGAYDYLFAHLSETRVRVGDKVRPGTIVGLTGSTGNSSGPHLHFEVRPANGRYGSDVNPRKVRRR